MRTTKTYSHVSRRFFRPEIVFCPACHNRLRRYATLSSRTIITLHETVHVTHCGYRCFNPACSAQARRYRSAAADRLALPGFTFGLDIVLFVGQAHFAEHQTLDEVHQHLQQRLGARQIQVSRREIFYLFDAYCHLLQAGADVAQDSDWRQQVLANGGLIVSIDGIQPDKGDETIYLVRDVLTGRLLTAANVSSSDTAVMKQVLAPVAALALPVVGVISDAQASVLLAVAALWPEVPHQTCQFHYLREMARPIVQVDRTMRKEIRKAIQKTVRPLREQVAKPLQTGQASNTPEKQRESEQWQVVADYALGIQAALNLEGLAPFGYPGMNTYEALEEIAESLERLKKKGQV